MKKPQGHAFTFAPDEEVVEQHTITCSHCDVVVFIDKEKTAIAAGCKFCPKCELFVCPRCARWWKRCTPLEKRLLEMEKRLLKMEKRAA